MKNKIKWILKRILIVSNYPKQTIFSFTNKDKMSLFHTAYENKKLMNTESSKIEEPRLEKLKDLDFDKLTNQSKKSSAHLNDSINKDYFSNLNNYGYGVKLLKISNFQEFNFLKKIHLYPANVFVLNEIKTLLDRSEIGGGLIIDYPSGIGNLLIYLEEFYDKNKLYGIDNFEQISKNDVKKYQQEMDRFQEFIHANIVRTFKEEDHRIKKKDAHASYIDWMNENYSDTPKLQLSDFEKLMNKKFNVKYHDSYRSKMENGRRITGKNADGWWGYLLKKD